MRGGQSLPIVLAGQPPAGPEQAADGVIDDYDISQEKGQQQQVGSSDPAKNEASELNGLDAVTSAATANSLAAAQAELPPQKPWYRQPNPLRWGRIPPIPDRRPLSRENSASWFSRLTFSWMTPLMSTGYRRPLELNDMWQLNPDRAMAPLSDRFAKAFRSRVDKGDRHPLWWALHECFFAEFWVGSCLALTASIFQVMAPFTLRYLIQFASDAWTASETGQPAPPVGVGIGLVLGVSAMVACQSLATNHFLYRGMMVGGQSRGVLIGAIFEKAMVLSGRARAGGAMESSEESSKEESSKEAKSSKEESSKEENSKEENSKEAKSSKEESSKEESSKEENSKEEKSSKENNSKEEKNSKNSRKDTNRAGVAGDGSGYSNGRIVNLMSVDTFRIDQASGFFHLSWAAPTSCLITLAMLLINLTYSALAGFALLCVGVPLLIGAIRSLFARREAINKLTDQRVSMTQELLSAVRFVKYFAWESTFLDRLQSIRDTEIHGIQMLLSIRNAILAVSISMPIFAAMLSFITYSLSRHDMHPAQIFSSLALFNALRIPLNLLPNVLGQIVDAWSSMERIQEFLMAEEQHDEAVLDMDGDNALELHAASFTWERNTTPDAEHTRTKKKPDAGQARPVSARGGTDTAAAAAAADGQLREPFKLEDLSISFARNELVAVIGPVGCGKSSLLAALAGDMRRTSGEAVLGASRAFCPQYAWIQNTTVRDNILFGKPMDRQWYQQVIQACALQADLDMLPSGDLTEIGERGITISGGQKQRLNIARAIYFSSDIVLMDDPLSAVDAHVGRHIFDHAILGLLGAKCRVLATHQLWVLHRCDRVVWMDAGRIKAVDTFDNLMRDDASFRQLLETTAVEEKGAGGSAADKDREDEKDDEKETRKKRDLDKRTRQKAAALMQQEERAVSGVSWSVYASYLRASGSLFSAPLVLVLLVLTQGANIAASLWLSAWTSNRWGLPTGVYIGGYAALGFGQTVFLFFYAVTLTVLGTRASKVLARAAVWRVLRAPMGFFDTTPLGRITNRFSRDIDITDNSLSESIRMFCSTMSTVVSVFVLVIVFYYYFAAALVPLLVVFLFSASYYRASAREVKRFESVLRSNVFARFSEGLTGVSSIRAYGLGGLFAAKMRDAVDDMNSVYFLTFSNQRWLSTRLDSIGSLLVLASGILVVASRFSVAPSIAGLVLSYIVGMVQIIQFSIRQLAEVENNMISVERLQYYGTRLHEEAPLHTTDVPPSWPDKGEIAFRDVAMRYRPGLPLVLRGLTMHVRAGERIGIVGRTGAGKSSIVSTLFRLSELAAGSITLDGLDIAKVGLHDLRSRLAIIPQDPTLFKGTVRTNLDPFGERTDIDLWSALRRADLVADDGSNRTHTHTHTHSTLNDVAPTITLDTQVEEDGLNFSLGQRQLMALARALVRDARVIICDEATSSVDVETDDRIQRTITTNFTGRTLLCIAHRLRTIVGYDRVCVMDAGTIAELDTPAELWRRGGIFRSMCERGGIRAEDIPGAAAHKME